MHGTKFNSGILEAAWRKWDFYKSSNDIGIIVLHDVY